ncbi:CHAP domain-containing protein [Agrobacterium vitis]|nr:CHAP domain-containing protein [Agrobacterium vitis]UJL89579.1 CHAP domain-containing protein [Agrobacterium vitis]
MEFRVYARGWPREYNPIIIELFKATGLNPLAPEFDGDDTPWCAAFVNYCIARAVSKDGKLGPAELKRGTRSASSGSFRCFGTEVPTNTTPRIGDIAVWALEGTVNACKPGTGHVGFFAGLTNDPEHPYFILGGNQSGDLMAGTETRRDGMILKPMPMKYLAKKTPPAYKTFQGFRTAAYL